MELLRTRNYINAKNQVIYNIKAIKKNLQQSKEYFIMWKPFPEKNVIKN